MPTSEEINGLITVLETANSQNEEDKIQAALWLHRFIQITAQKAVSDELASMGTY